MAISEELRIEIVAQSKKAISELKKTETATGKLASSVKKYALAAAGSAGAIAITRSLVKFMGDASEAAAAQESAVIRLGAALDATGQSGGDAIVDMQEFASSLQKVSVVGDEVSLGLMQMGVNMGLSVEQTKVATKQSIALSRAYGIDLNTAMIGVVNTMQGQTSTLTRYIPSLKAATDETERMAILNDEAAKAWAVTTQEVNSAAGAQAQLKNAVGDSKEIIGQYINDQLTPWRQKMLEIVETTNEAWQAQADLKRAIQSQKEGNATLEEQLAILVGRRARYTGATRAQKAALDAEIDALKIQIERQETSVALGREAARVAEAEAQATVKNTVAVEDNSAAIEEAAQSRLNALATLKDMENANADEIAQHYGEQALLMAEADRKRLDDAKKNIEEETAARMAATAYAVTLTGSMFDNLADMYNANTEEGKKAAKAAAIVNKGISIFNAYMSTKEAITKALTAGPIAGPILAGVIGAMGAANIALMAAKPIPMAEGGVVLPSPGGTIAQIGEAGRPEAVIPLDKAGGFGATYIININSVVGGQEEVAAWVQEGIERAKRTGRVAA